MHRLDTFEGRLTRLFPDRSSPPVKGAPALSFGARVQQGCTAVVRVLTRAVSRPRGGSVPLSAIHVALLERACAAIRSGNFDEAEALLCPRSTPAADARVSNLMGIVCEARRAWNPAMRWYGRAMRADRRYAPAQQNMRRMYELHTFGRSAVPVCFGDEPPDERAAGVAP